LREALFFSLRTLTQVFCRSFPDVLHRIAARVFRDVSRAREINITQSRVHCLSACIARSDGRYSSVHENLTYLTGAVQPNAPAMTIDIAQSAKIAASLYGCAPRYCSRIANQYCA
jgi:hypothetical protein